MMPLPPAPTPPPAAAPGALPAPPGVPPAGPHAPSPQAATPRRLTDEQTSAWWGRIDAALAATKPAIEKGKVNVARYGGQYYTSLSTEDRIAVPTDFYYIEQKKSQLFYRLPDIFLKPEQPGLEDAAVVFQAAINKQLGVAGVNVLPRVQQVIFDILCAVGYGAVKVGYQTVQDGTIDVQVGEEPDLAAMQPGAVLGLGPMPMKPVMEKAPNIVAEWLFIEHIPAGDLLVPAEFKGLDFDDAPWLGMAFEDDNLEGEFGGSDRADDDRRLTPVPDAARTAARQVRKGYEVWYKAHRFDTDIKHPDQYRMFKVYDDAKNEPIEVKDSPYQQCAPSGKRLEGMAGNPICPLTIRCVSDTWLPQSDCAMARATADELSAGRTAMVQFRHRNMPQTGYDTTRITKDALGKIERNENAGWVGFDGPMEDASWSIHKGEFSRENFTFNDIAQGDLGRIWGLGGPQLGNADDTAKTATVEQIAQTASQSRLEAERNLVLGWYSGKVVPKFAALMQLFTTQEEFVELVGADAERLSKIPPEVQQQAQKDGKDARALVPWNKDTIKGKFTFAAKPNSQVYLDIAQEDKRLLDRYQLFANSPTINRAELERAMLARDGFDPGKMMQQPPAKGPEPPKLNFSVSGADLIGPQAPIVIEVLTQLGLKISPGAVQQSQGLLLQQQQLAEAEAQQKLALQGHPKTEHPGAAAEVEPLAKHPLDQTGGLQGSGAPAPMGPGGQL